MTASKAPAVGRIAARLAGRPQQMLADGDYTNRRSIEAMAELDVGLCQAASAKAAPTTPALDASACHCESGVLIRRDLFPAEQAGLRGGDRPRYREHAIMLGGDHESPSTVRKLPILGHQHHHGQGHRRRLH